MAPLPHRQPMSHSMQSPGPRTWASLVSLASCGTATTMCACVMNTKPPPRATAPQAWKGSCANAPPATCWCSRRQ
eukprot:1134179-Pelagomonas_calceolata.AAC.6